MRLILTRLDRGGATKLAWEVGEDRVVEATAFVPSAHSNADAALRGVVCVSCQAGCNVACTFCASGRQTRLRNLTAAEMIEQAVAGRGCLDRTDGVSVTFSGMGEPLQNVREVISAANQMCDSLGFTYASLSTVGIPAALKRLADARPATHLFVSLHATTDDLRRRLIPSRACYPVAEVVAAAERYAEKAQRHVKVSYLLIPGVNDSPADGERLAQILHPSCFVVQLLLWNKVEGLHFVRADRGQARSFAEALIARGLPTIVQESGGQEIDGACGQLAGALVRRPAPR